MHAVKGMLPDNRLRATMLTRLFVFSGSEHPYNEKFVSKGEKNNMAAAKSQIVERKTHTRGNYINAVGRRKEAVARVRLHETVQEGMMWGKIEIKKEISLLTRK